MHVQFQECMGGLYSRCASHSEAATKHSTARKPSFLAGLFFWGALAE